MIHLYVEHLINIRTLSLQASLSTFSNKETKATLSADGDSLTLIHENETASIKLPINISPNQESDATLIIPAKPSKDLNFRIQLEEKQNQLNGTSLLQNGQPDDGNVIPWTADALTSDTEIRCRECNTPLVARGRIRSWKDLPSEGWAEMMEFWHCHKPHDAHDHGSGEGLKKGYAAGSQLVLEAGVGMVDPLDFLLLPDDCINVEVRQPSSEAQDERSILQCNKCHTILGHIEVTTGGFKLRKLNLSVASEPDMQSVSYNKQQWLACFLLCAMDTKGVRKFLVRNHNRTLRLWLFTPDLTISSSASTSTEPVRVVKIMWQEVDSSEQAEPERLTTASLAEDELSLLADETRVLRDTLEHSAQLLPPGARTFQTWNVGLLERFTSADVAPP